jgi:hypothetical protein
MLARGRVRVLRALGTLTLIGCALVRYVFRAVVNGESYPKLTTRAQENGMCDNQMEGGANLGATLSIRLRWYDPAVGGTDDEAKVLPGTRPRVLAGKGHHTQKNEATSCGADGQCPARLSWMRLSWPRQG